MREFGEKLIDVLGIHMYRAGQGKGLSFEIERVTQVDNLNLFAHVNHVLQLPRRNAGNPEFPQEFPTLNIFSSDIDSKRCDQKHNEELTQALGVVGNIFQLIAENITKADIATSPQQTS